MKPHRILLSIVLSASAATAASLVHTPRAAAQPADSKLIVRVEGTLIAPTFGEQLRASIAKELGIEVVLDPQHALVGTSVTIKIVDEHEALIVLFAKGGSVARTINLPDNAARKIDVLTLLIGNIARDEVGDWLAQLHGKVSASYNDKATSLASSATALQPTETPPVAPVASATTPPVVAQEVETASPNHHNFELGVRTGYGIPIGDMTEMIKLSDAVSARIPIVIDGEYFASPHLTVGLQLGFSQILAQARFPAGFGYGYAYTALPGEAPAVTASTAWANILEAALTACWHSNPTGSIDPWVSVALGWNVLEFQLKSDAISGQTQGNSSSGLTTWTGDPNPQSNLWGPTFGVDLGLNFRAIDDFHLGPFVSAVYSAYCNSIPGGPNTGDTEYQSANGRTHGWILFGVRGEIDLRL